ncbi:MAG: response regulator transcription factor [Sphingomonadaceae bacterium]|nr:response regulator transcription factor [Sphingomonadaceae bacterium]
MTNQLKVLIINQNEIEGEGLRRILIERSFDVVGVFRNYTDVLLVDNAISDASCLFVVCGPSDETTLEVCRMVHDMRPDAPVVMLAHECESVMIARSFRAGVSGYISKDTSCASLVAMIRLVALGEKVIPSHVVYDLAALDTGLRLTENEVRMGDANISEREIEILRGLIRGEPNKIISRRLNITEATVKVHVKSILRKLQVVNRTQAAIWALSRGLSGECASTPQEDIALPFPAMAANPPFPASLAGKFVGAA